MKEHPYVLLIAASAGQAYQLELLLTRAGYQVEVSSNGADGWHEACLHHPRLILLDIDTPTMDGLHVLFFLKRMQSTANIPVVMLTGTESVDRLEEATALGADGYLFKEDHLQESARHIIKTIDQFAHAWPLPGA